MRTATKDELEGRVDYKATWFLVDAHKGFESPALFTMEEGSKPFFVVTSSPRREHWNWILKCEHRFFFMNPWTWEEIVQG